MNHILWSIRYAWLCLRRIPASFLWHPWFVTLLTIRRLLFTVTRRFVGPSLVSPITGETIFNVQSLINAYQIQVVRELDGPWQTAMRDTPAPVVFDVGSNIGQFRYYMLALNPGARVWTFDPWLEMQNYVPPAMHRTVALGACMASASLYRAEVGWTATTQPGVYPKQTVQVTTEKLDNEWDRIGNPQVDLLKIDVDGAEFEVLAGAKRVLEWSRFVLIETTDIKRLNSAVPGRVWTTKNGYDYCGVKA
jgi:FkbM family methyltransferase